MVTFAVFFSYGENVPALELELLSTFSTRLKRVHPEARLLVLCDPQTASKLQPLGYELHVGRVERETLLLDRLKLFRSVLAEAQSSGVVCLLDYDILVLRRIDILDRLDFDVVYTFRKRATKYPLNGGFVVARVTRAAREFFDDVFAAYSKLSKDKLSWWGDQIGVWDRVSPHIDTLREEIFDVGGAKLLLLDGEHHNWTPFDFDTSTETLTRNLFLTQSLVKDSESKPLIHFKGRRKHLQFGFHRYLQSSDCADAPGPLLFGKAGLASQSCDLGFFEGQWFLQRSGSASGFERVSIVDLIAAVSGCDVVRLTVFNHPHERPVPADRTGLDLWSPGLYAGRVSQFKAS